MVDRFVFSVTNEKLYIFAAAQNYDYTLRYFIEFSYNGANYHGWQLQPNAVTVQEVLENALSILIGEKINLSAAGRTDAGVHAKQMFAHFDYEADLPENLLYRINSFLPKDIAVSDFISVTPEAHARFDAVERTYNYLINTEKDVFMNALGYNFYHILDIAEMNKASTLLLDYRDFQCFSKSNTDVRTYNCKIVKAHWTINNGLIKFEISADRFLRNMVRAIVGTMINLGSGKIKIEDLKQIIESKDRSKAGFSVPAQGLYLMQIEYPSTIFLNR